jgi:hypothetical protein
MTSLGTTKYTACVGRECHTLVAGLIKAAVDVLAAPVGAGVRGGREDGATAVRHFHARNVRKVQHAMRANKTQNMPISTCPTKHLFTTAPIPAHR